MHCMTLWVMGTRLGLCAVISLRSIFSRGDTSFELVLESESELELNSDSELELELEVEEL